MMWLLGVGAAGWILGTGFSWAFIAGATRHVPSPFVRLDNPDDLARCA